MPVVFIEAPPGVRPDAKQRMVEKITAAMRDPAEPAASTTSNERSEQLCLSNMASCFPRAL
jgi:hypothetical protein